MDSGDMRAADADRQRVAERLQSALDEGRLNLYEYDERLREAYAAKTYAELDKLLADLPGTVPPSKSQLVPTTPNPPVAYGQWQPGPDGRYAYATRRWIGENWGNWAGAVGICVGIWTVLWLLGAIGGDDGLLPVPYFWPGWVAGPWGVVLLVSTITGLMRDEPQRWAAKQARKEAEREVRRSAKRDKHAENGTGDGPED